MLTLFARHGRFDLTLSCKGDTHVDAHHSVEDIGLCLGSAFAEALGDMRGVTRYADVILPMDEALVLCAVDISGRGWLSFNVELPGEKIGTMDTELVEEFLLAFVRKANVTLHMKQLCGGKPITLLRPALRHCPHACQSGKDRQSYIRTKYPPQRSFIVITPLDYGVGNLFSLRSSFKYIGQDAEITGDAEAIRRSDRILCRASARLRRRPKLRESGLDIVVCEEARKANRFSASVSAYRCSLTGALSTASTGPRAHRGNVVSMEPIVPEGYKYRKSAGTACYSQRKTNQSALQYIKRATITSSTPITRRTATIPLSLGGIRRAHDGRRRRRERLRNPVPP